MDLKPLQFGSVTVDFPVLLAPMAGYTDAAMRTLCLEQGAGAVYTELTSAEGIRRDSQNTFAALKTAGGEHPIAGHIFGRDPEAMAEAAKYVEQTGQFDWIDLNCGCPVKKVVSRGAGAALLKDLPTLGKMISRVRKAVSLPLSVKTRIGFNQDTADHLDIAHTVEESGADMIAVHARLAKNFHGGDPDYEKLGEMKQLLNIPILGNGGVQSLEDAERMVRISGVDGVMIGRGAIGNPWIFDSIRRGGTDACDTVRPASIGLQEKREMMAEHLRRLVELNEKKQEISARAKRYTAEEAACIQFRTHIPYYVKGLFGKKQLLMKLARLMTVGAIMEEIDRLVEKNQSCEAR
ncbi:tRNA dihydrouridine synthase [Pontiella agarivorans]|uniref:tRNA-dihydrouridine synthase n=1 Tax=Pontiella agarivorans TaxID=3038953 RepID=A0ABU5MZC1_9BACT|nr:tRNA-dihydrouridine synthase family protein [Pontiella agarivorans]MDZ8119559.1 tRNA-dihydrouridine synthase family protein [Pontiella agarivorans]